MPLTVPPLTELVAPPGWRTVDFIADLHLQATEEATFLAWQRYLAQTEADAVFILGDLFEVWVGDDVLQDSPPQSGQVSFEARCAEVLQRTAQRVDLFFMHGNRDFLVGADFLRQCQTTLLPDPTVLAFGGRRWLLTHGDALCLADTDYLQFRHQVRSPEWQDEFLARPLAQRQAMARDIRQQSEARKRRTTSYADVDAGCACNWLAAAQASTMIHGHTHRPAVHDLGHGRQRWVLSDWDCSAPRPRAEVLRLQLGADTAQEPVRLQRLAVPTT